MRLFSRDESLFFTHTPDAYQPGSVWSDNDRRYEVTRLKRLAPTKTVDGWYAPCFEVFGRLEESADG